MSRHTVPDAATILVVDDNPNNRDLISRRLERAGYAVEAVEDGAGALSRLESSGGGRPEIDLLVLDVMMPGLSGMDVLRAIRRRRSKLELPVIMATAKTGSEDVVEALDLGANDYVTKPIDFPVLLARIDAQLQMSRAASAQESPKEARFYLAELRPGLVLADKYRIEEEIGSGNFGTVFRATHLAFEQPVAVKVLRASVDDTDDEHLRRFQREGSSALRLQHPNAVTVMDFAIAHGLAFLVMEMLRGESLDAVSKRDLHLPPARALELMVPVCEVLAEAHALGIIHRDIKPANIFLCSTRRGEVVKVLDFGIAKMVDQATAEQALTLDEGILGTPAYMAPERLHGSDYDGRSDVYSLGIVLYQLLAGTFPFQVRQNDAMATAIQHLTAAPTPLREHLPNVPLELEAAVMSTLHKPAAERPTAAELGERLSAVLRSELARSGPVPRVAHHGPFDDETTALDPGTAARLAFDFGDLLVPQAASAAEATEPKGIPGIPPAALEGLWT
ncbi:MAG: protein kinase [Holophagales bacterium]|nr:protein kinase [Holophagales bacterium]